MTIKETHLDLEESKEIHIPDIDIDVANRDMLLNEIKYNTASIVDKNIIKKHNVGIYLQNIPTDPLTNLSSIDYKDAEKRGWMKIDILNLEIYNSIGSNKEIEKLMSYEPNWELFKYKSIVKSLFHISDHFNIVEKISPRSLEDLAIIVALKMPAKKYLLDKSIEEIKENIWKKESGIYFKKSHSFAYAQIIWIQLNFIVDKIEKGETN